MTKMKTLLATAAAAALLAGCAAPARHPMGHGPGDMGMHGAGGMAGPRTGMPMDVEKHRQSMQQMHERIAAAKTPAERQALMQEHMRLMHEGMGLMSRMGRGGPGAAAGPSGGMEMRMDMMESMMQMMTDRMELMQPK